MDNTVTYMFKHILYTMVAYATKQSSWSSDRSNVCSYFNPKHLSFLIVTIVNMI